MIFAAILAIVFAFSKSPNEDADYSLLNGLPSPIDSQINCTETKSLYESHFCRIFTNAEKYQRQCLPVRYLPPPEMLVKGVVINYHGFTACPDAFIPYSKRLAEQGYIVLTPLIVGHGINLEFGCKKVKCINNVNPSELPTDKNQYIAWSEETLVLVNEQIRSVPESRRAPDFRVSAIGISVGGALALFAAQLPQSPFNSLVLVNPYLATTVPVLDFLVKNCEDDKNPRRCVTKLFKDIIRGNPTDKTNYFLLEPIILIFKLVKQFNYSIFLLFVRYTLVDSITNRYDRFWMHTWEKLGYLGDHKLWRKVPIFKSGYSWGKGCGTTDNRGGYCDLYFKNLLAIQSFCTYTLSALELVDRNVDLALIHSDVDGTIRDSMSISVLKAINNRRNNKIRRCRFKLIQNRTAMPSTIGNLGGAPHSLFSLPEAKNVPPYIQYWRDGLYETLDSFLNSGELANGKGPNECEPTFEHLDFGEMYYSIGDRFLNIAKKIYGKQREDEVLAYLNAHYA